MLFAFAPFALILIFFNPIIAFPPKETNASNGNHKGKNVVVPLLPPRRSEQNAKDLPLPSIEPFYGAELNTHPYRRTSFHRVVLDQGTPRQNSLEQSYCQKDEGGKIPQTVIYYASISRRIPINRPISPSSSSVGVTNFKAAKTNRKRPTMSHVRSNSEPPLFSPDMFVDIFRGADMNGVRSSCGKLAIDEASLSQISLKLMERQAAEALQERKRIMTSIQLSKGNQSKYVAGSDEEDERLYQSDERRHLRKSMTPVLPPPKVSRAAALEQANKFNGNASSSRASMMARCDSDNDRENREASLSDESSSIRGPWNNESSSSGDTSDGAPDSPHSPPPPPTSFRLERHDRLVREG